MVLEVKDITKKFQNNQVLHGINFSVRSGHALGLLGRNGAGKTTTIRVIMGVYQPETGEVLLDGKKFDATNISIGYLPEERGMYPDIKVIDQLMYMAKLRGLSSKEAKKNSEYWLERFKVTEYANKLLQTLSKGNQQKVQLAQTLVSNPEVVVLDEPFSGLDPVNSQILKDVVYELIDSGKIVIFSSHQMSYVEEFCKDIVIVNKGHIVLEGDLKQIKTHYGKNKLTISAVNYTLDELYDKLKSYTNVFTELTIAKSYLIVSLKEGKTKQDMLNILLESGVDIEAFKVYEPNLHDIFVKEVGESA
ncbi:MAG: ABC transporter ATP-binding protein [Epulopiscium sp. Nuni2H_MBin003]|nr:MAG: ABC transporter ATP-binding protein [Epulopiscium sp. Nuni2H_MBin003]